MFLKISLAISRFRFVLKKEADSGGFPVSTALVRFRIDAVFGTRFQGCPPSAVIFGVLRVTLMSLDSNKNDRGPLLRGEA